MIPLLLPVTVPVVSPFLVVVVGNRKEVKIVLEESLVLLRSISQEVPTVNIEFFFCGTVGVVFVRQFVHLADHFFSTIQFQLGFSEPCITNEPIVNAQEFSFLTLLLELICSVVFSITFFLSVSVTMGSTFPDVEIRNREEVEN